MPDYVTTEQFEKFLEEERDHHRAADDRVRAVEVQVAAVGQQVAALGLQLAPVQKQLEQHHKTLYGNGEPGMDEIMRRVVKFMDEFEQAKEDKDKQGADDKRWMTRLIVGVVITQILTAVVTILLAK